MNSKSLIAGACRHVAVKGLDASAVQAKATELWSTVLDKPDGFQAAELARAVARALSTPRKPRLTLTDLADLQRLAHWLGADGNPPIVEMSERSRRHGYKITTEQKPVADRETAEIWWSEYRRELLSDWCKSALNPCKPQTHSQFLAECLSQGLGIKKGSVQDRLAAAKLARPDLYAQDDQQTQAA